MLCHLMFDYLDRCYNQGMCGECYTTHWQMLLPYEMELPIVLGYIVLVRTTFSSDLEEAMTESGESLSNSKNYCSVFEKISKINDVKQNEKHPFT